MSDLEPSPPLQKSHIGKWTVYVMFGFGLTMVGMLWVLFEFHTRPFRPVTEALHAAYPNSRPLVQGGLDKKQDGTPSILRVILTVTFDPQTEEDQYQEAIQTIQTICKKTHDLSPYDRMEIHLIQVIPEKEVLERKTEINLRM